MKTLLAVTTYNQIEYTKKFVTSLKQISLAGVDVAFFDDVSTDGTQAYLKNAGFTVFERPKPMGLTRSWNLAYQKFISEGYDVLIISNNDVLLTKTAVENLINASMTGQLACPLSTKRGAGHNWQEQAIEKYYPGLEIMAQDPANHIKVNTLIKNEVIRIKNFNGFIFAVSKRITASQFSNGHLFNPALTNVGQESDLRPRLKEQPLLVKGSFFFHYKGVSFPVAGIKNGYDIRQNLNLYH
jgi:hypothetical protein